LAPHRARIPRGGANSSSSSSNTSAAANNCNSSNSNGKSAAKAYKQFFALPEPVRFCVSACMGTYVFYVAEKWFSSYVSNQMSLPAFLAGQQDTISFFLAYLFQIGVQHFLNAILVFGWDSISTKQKYINTLMGSYSAYFSTATGSTIFNAFLRKMGMDKGMAFAITISTFGMINFFVVKWVVNTSTPRPPKKNDDQKQSGSTIL